MVCKVMSFITKISVLFAIGCFTIVFSFAQEPMESDIVTTETLTENTIDEEYDSEATIIEAETEEAQQCVDVINNIIDIIADLEEANEMIRRFAIYNIDNSIVEYDEYEQSAMIQKFDVIKAKDNEDYDFTFIRQTVFNANRQAWDFIYERVYNQDGKLIFFVRKYNTYNSGCAEVAFERSEYYYSQYGNLSKKTYEIFDSNNNALELDDCWMERELYEQITTYQDFITKYPLPL